MTISEPDHEPTTPNEKPEPVKKAKTAPLKDLLGRLTAKPSGEKPMGDEEVQDRFTNIMAEPDQERQPRYDWRTRSVIQPPIPEAPNSTGQEETPPENGVVLYGDASAQDDAGHSLLPPVEEDYLYKEWMGLTRKLPALLGWSLGNNQEGEDEGEKNESQPAPAFSFPEETDELAQVSHPDEPQGRINPFIFTSSRGPDSTLELRELVLEGLEEEAAADEAAGRDAKKPAGRWGKLEIGLAILALVLVAGIAFLFLSDGMRKAAPAPTVAATVEPTSMAAPTATFMKALPNTTPMVEATRTGAQVYPVEILIPPDTSFTLSMSTIVNGSWKPDGPEWLDGTEVNRIVALPWSADLEAKVTQLKNGDKVTLFFNNQGDLFYIVQKVEKVPTNQPGLYNVEQPSLLILLYGEGSEDRWVVTAYPE